MTKTITHRSHAAHRNGADSNLRTLLTQAKSTISDVGAQASENAQALRERLSSTLTAAQKRAKAVAKGVRQQASRADDAIRAKPYHAMAVAGGIGLIAGLLIARRRDSR